MNRHVGASGSPSKLRKILAPLQSGLFWRHGQPAASPPAGRDGLCRRLYSVNPKGFGGCVNLPQKVVKKPDFPVRYHVNLRGSKKQFSAVAGKIILKNSQKTS
jgi:hypothetical protein